MPAIDPPFDVFLSYNRVDAEAVRDVRARLSARGVLTFVDWNDLEAGLPWPSALESALRRSRAVAVFVGRSGLGPWQTREMHYALELQARSNALPVIPVLLHGAEPPAGFLALNKWVDLRGGIDDESLVPLIQSITASSDPSPRLIEVCPYRDLRSFREEDAPLFFGRGEAVEAIVAKLDHARLVTVVGPSGSGKSSIVSAGVLPRLRRRRWPQLVWEHIVFTPGDAPWLRLSHALTALLDPVSSEAQRLHDSALLAEAIQRDIGGTIARVLQKSRGSDRLLVVIDQGEELFTLADEQTARGFIRSMLDACRITPMAVLLTLRSDYYGKAIALERNLSDALPDTQVNIGPLRRSELHDIIMRPAALVGLQFEPGLVERILDDVGGEPGHLPLLEYALTELWKLRVSGTLTFAAYQEIGQVASALTRRADTLYAELSEVEKVGARRLMTRLVRVAAVDEEGADTRRRARRDEIDDEAWKLVDFFAGPRARLLVVGSDPASGGDSVEVAHEALIRKWNRLRDWIDEDRKFLLWRQQLTVYRAAFVEGLPPEAVAEAQRWLRARRAELSSGEREYIERSVAKRTRTRWLRRVAIAAAVMIVATLGGWLAYLNSALYSVREILQKRPESHALVNLDDEEAEEKIVTLIRLGLGEQVRLDQSNARYGDTRPHRLAVVAVAMHQADSGRAATVLRQAITMMQGSRTRPTPETLSILAFTAYHIGERGRGRVLLEEAERASIREDRPFDDDEIEDCFVVATIWKEFGEPQRARRIVQRLHDKMIHNPGPLDPFAIATFAERLAMLGAPSDHEMVEALASLAENALREAPDRAEAVYSRVGPARAYLGDRDGAKRAFAAIKDEDRRNIDLLRTGQRLVMRGDVDEASELISQMNVEELRRGLFSEVCRALLLRHRDADVRRIISSLSLTPFERRTLRLTYARSLVQVGRLSEAQLLAESLATLRQGTESAVAEPEYAVRAMEYEVTETFAELAERMARAGRSKDARAAIHVVTKRINAMSDTDLRDSARVRLTAALAAAGLHRQARLTANSIEDSYDRWPAYFAILRHYVEAKRPAKGTS